MTTFAAKKLYDVLTSPMWPHGFCALHVFTRERCHGGCIRSRVEFARVAHALERYWLLVDMEQRSAQRRDDAVLNSRRAAA